MSDFSHSHPTPEQLVAFAEGELTNAGAIESHVDACPECARTVVRCRSLLFRQQLHLITPLSPNERAQEKERLRQLFNSTGTSKPTSGSSFLASVAGLGGALGLSHVPHGPKPVLADHEKPVSTSPSEESHKSEETSPTDVTNHGDVTSVSGETTDEHLDDVAEILRKLEETLSHEEPIPETEIQGWDSDLTTDDGGSSTRIDSNDFSQLDDSVQSDHMLPSESLDLPETETEHEDIDTHDDDLENMDI